MISRFFIDRPIFATVLSVVITLIGGISLYFLPVAQYPRITPPGVSISISYPGASAQVVADTVAAPIEQQVNGVEGMLYMSSNSGNDGTYSLTVTFDIGTDLNAAVVKVQNRVALAMPQLPSPGAEPGDHDPQEDAGHPHDREFLFSHETLRRHLPEQLRHHQRPRRAPPSARRVGHHLPGRAGLQHPLLAQAAEDGGLQHHGCGRGQRRTQPEPRLPGGLGRPAAHACRAGLRIAHRHIGTTQRAGAVRPDHRQGQHVFAAAVAADSHGRAAHGQFRHAGARLPLARPEEPRPATTTTSDRQPRATQPPSDSTSGGTATSTSGGTSATGGVSTAGGATTGGGATSGGGGTTGGGGNDGRRGRGRVFVPPSASATASSPAKEARSNRLSASSACGTSPTSKWARKTTTPRAASTGGPRWG